MLNLYVKAQILGMKARNLMKRQEGQGMVEYGLIIGLVAAVVIGAIALLGGQIRTLFNNLTNQIPSGTAQ
ncbi:MAG: Flp family type IVb pilin [Bacillota bacterium]